MRRVLVGVLFAIGCTTQEAPQKPTGPVAETVSPANSPMKYRVLADEVNTGANSVEYHLLIGPDAKHDDVTKLLQFLYRHLMTRREPAPASLAGFVYTDEAQYKTPPRSPVAQVVQKPGELGPTFDNKVPLEFWQQVEQAMPKADKGWKLAKKVERNDPARTLVVTQPFTEPGEDKWAERLSFNMALNEFTDTAKAYFENVPELKSMKYVGIWKDQEVVRIDLDRADYMALKIPDIEEQIGSLHGRAYLEMSAGRGTDASITKANAQRMASVYKKMLGQLKGKAWVSPTLK